jgi:tetratricopeptide (TPR) repeat protein
MERRYNMSNDPHALKVTAGLLLVGVLLFAPSFNDPFHFDDVLITNDANVTHAAQWWHFFNPFHLRQLTFFTFYLNHLVGGLDPSGYHVVNVVIHIANAVLLFLLLGRFVERWIAVAAAAVFLVHPIQTSAVLYIYERSTLLACFFSLLALIALAERRTGWAAVFFILAFEGKESAVGVPLALALLNSPPQPRRGGAKRRGGVGQQSISLTSTTPAAATASALPSSAEEGSRFRKTLFAGAALMTFATLAILIYWNEETVGIAAAARISPFRYFLTETRVVFTYMRLLVVPWPQSLEYEFQNAGGFLSAVGAAAVVLIGWLCYRSARFRVPGLCILAFFVLLAPTSSIIPSADAAFEHRLYIPMLAFAVFAATLLARLPRRSVVSAAVLIALAILTVRRETVWSSDIALWEDTAQKAPGKARVWFNLGGAYLNTDPDKARAALRRALELQPHFTEALYDLGVIEQEKKNWNMALAYYEQAVGEQPTYWPAWNNMANTLFALGQHDRARDYLETTLRLNRDYWPAQYNLAIVHFTSGRYADAVPKLRTVLDWQPEFREARYLLATSLTRAGDRQSADVEWKKLGAANAAESRTTPTMILAPSRP